MTTRTPDYVDPGHKPVWPNGELPAMRNMYDELLAEQNADRKDKAQR